MKYAARVGARTLAAALVGLAAGGCALAHAPGGGRADAGPRDQGPPRDVPDGLDAPDADAPDADAGPDAPDAPACPVPGQRMCGGRCVDVTTSAATCGEGCINCAMLPGVNPAGGATCSGGACVIDTACEPGRADCDHIPSNGCEADVTTAAQCGACGAMCPASMRLCALTDGRYVCQSDCLAPNMMCGAACTNVATDAANCGACGNRCPAPANGASTCAASACGIRCNAGFHACGAACAPDGDVNSCGAMCSPCPAPANAAATCAGGACGFTCNAGFHRCGTTCAPDASTAMCGTGCVPCATPANGAATCMAGACGFTCNPGFHPCGTSCLSNSAVASCGASCTPCPAPANGTAVCASGGMCDFNCNAGYMRMGTSCVATTCPNRMIDGAETCDDGNTAGGDGCRPDCTLEMPAATSCAGTPLRIATGGAQVYTGNTTGGTSAIACNGGSPGGRAAERVYEIDPQFSGMLQIRLHPTSSTYDSVLIVRNNCSSPSTPAELACVSGGGAGTDHVATVAVTASTHIWVIIDGQGGSEGPYTLTFTPM